MKFLERLCFVFVFVLFSRSVNAQSRTFYVPAFTTGAYSNNLLASNPSAQAASLSISAYSSAGAVIGSTSVNVPAGTFQTISIGSALGLAGGVSGWLNVSSNNPNIQIQYAFSDLQPADNGDILSRTDLLSTNVNFGLVSEAANVVTGYAIANPNSQATAVTLRLFDGSGNLKETESISIPAFGQSSQLFQQIFTSMPATFSGYATLQSALPVAGMEFIDEAGSIGLVEPQAAATVLYFSNSLSNSTYSSTISVASLSPISASVQLTAYNADGSLLQGAGIQNPRSFPIGPGGQLTMSESDIFGLTAGTTFNGLVIATANAVGNPFAAPPPITGLMLVAGINRPGLTVFAGKTTGAVSQAAYFAPNSSFVAQNPGSSASTVNITMQSGGSSKTSVQTIPANGSVFFTPATLGFGSQSGTIIVAGSSPVLVSDIEISNQSLQANVLEDTTAAPVITSIQPSPVLPGSVLTINGLGFGTDITQVQVFFFSAGGQLTLANPLTVANGTITLVASAGVTSVLVEIAGKFSTASLIQLANPVPVLTSISPATVAFGHASFAITATGENFVPGSYILFNGVPVSTTAVGPGLLTALVSSVALPASVPVAVQNPAPGGGVSNAATLAITRLPPQFQTYTTQSRPLGVAVYAGTLALTVNNVSGNISILDLTGGNSFASLPVGQGPTEIAINTFSSQAVVTNSGSNTISIVNLTSKTVTATVTVGQSPFGVATNGVNTAVVTNYLSNTVSIVDLPSATVTATVSSSLFLYPTGVAIDPLTNTAYIISSGLNEVVAVNLSSLAITNVTAIGSGANHIALTGDSPNRIVVTNNTSNSVSIYNFANSTLTTLNVPNGPNDIVVNSPQSMAFIGLSGQGSVVALDLSRNQLIGLVSIGDSVGGITYNPATFEVLATRQNLNSIAAFPYFRGGVTATFPVEATPRGLAVFPAGDRAVVANQGSNSVSLLNLQTQLVTARQPVGSSPVAVGIDGKRSIIYVVNSGDNNVSVLDGTSFSSIGAIRVGMGPVSIGIDTVIDIGIVANRSSGTVTFINLATQSAASTLTVSDPFDIAVDTNLHQAFVTSPATNSIYIIDLQAQSVSSAISTSGTPAGIDVLPSLSAFVAVDFSGHRLVTYQYGIAGEAASVGLPVTPLFVRLNSGTNQGVVTSADPTAASVTLFNVNSSLAVTPTATVAVAADTEDAAIDTLNNRAVVSSGTSNSVSIIQLP
jgi:YVTN family beta-propeller protein